RTQLYHTRLQSSLVMSTGVKVLYQFGGAAFFVSGLLFLSTLSESRRRRQSEGRDRVRNHGGGHPSLDGITRSSWASGLSRIWHPRQYARPRGVRRRYFLRWSTCDQSLDGNRDVRTESGHEEWRLREACGVSRV